MTSNLSTLHEFLGERYEIRFDCIKNQAVIYRVKLSIKQRSWIGCSTKSFIAAQEQAARKAYLELKVLTTGRDLQRHLDMER